MNDISARTSTVTGADGALAVYEAKGAEPKAGLVIVHEAFGVTDHIADVVRRAAGEGYYAVAPDLFHRAGGGVGSDGVAGAVQCGQCRTGSTAGGAGALQGIQRQRRGEAAGPPLTASQGSTDALLQDPVPQVRGVAGLDHLGPLQLDRTAEALEQPRTAVQDHWGDVQEQLVDQPGRQRLLDDAGAAHDVHPLVPSSHDRLLDGVLDALGDEPERGLAPTRWWGRARPRYG